MRIQNVRDLGLVIRDRRRSLNLDQQTLAEKVGVSRQWVIAVEKGKPRAEVALVLSTLRELGLDLSVSSKAEGMSPLLEQDVDLIDIDAVIDKARGRSK